MDGQHAVKQQLQERILILEMAFLFGAQQATGMFLAMQCRLEVKLESGNDLSWKGRHDDGL